MKETGVIKDCKYLKGSEEMERHIILKINDVEYIVFFKVYLFKIKILSIGKRFKEGCLCENIKFEVLENRKSTAIDYLRHFWINFKIYISKFFDLKRI